MPKKNGGRGRREMFNVSILLSVRTGPQGEKKKKKKDQGQGRKKKKMCFQRLCRGSGREEEGGWEKKKRTEEPRGKQKVGRGFFSKLPARKKKKKHQQKRGEQKPRPRGNADNVGGGNNTRLWWGGE